MTSPYMLGDIRRDEGYRTQAYPDPKSGADPWTIGYGHTGPDVHEGLTWTQEQANSALAVDVAKTSRQLDEEMPWWRNLDDLRQDAILNMAYNLGVAGLSKFTSFVALMQRSLFALAAHDLASTLWAKEVGERAERLAYQIRTGKRQV